MGTSHDRSYFRERAIEEQEAATQASCMVKDVHLELAELYAQTAEPVAPSKPGDARRAVR